MNPGLGYGDVIGRGRGLFPDLPMAFGRAMTIS